MSTPRISTLEVTPQHTYPVLVLGYEARRESQNVVHDIIGGGTAVSLLWSRERSGVLSLFYLDRATAYAAFDMLSQRKTFSFLEDYLTGGSLVDMLFAVDGDVSITLDPETRKRWIVDVGFRELSDS